MRVQVEMLMMKLAHQQEGGAYPSTNSILPCAGGELTVRTTSSTMQLDLRYCLAQHQAAVSDVASKLFSLSRASDATSLRQLVGLAMFGVGRSDAVCSSCELVCRASRHPGSGT